MLSREILSKPIAGAVMRENAIADYRIAFRSRVASLLGRREVLTGKAKFGIFGDGKELPQIAMARVFRNGDWRSGYYRDQTFAFASGMVTLKQFFAQLYANPDIEADPHSGGRQMNSHFATRILDKKGTWRRQIDMPNTAADLSPTASQMPRLAGLVQASRLYRNLPYQPDFEAFTQNGEEIAFGVIGNASCAEGHFWETLNAIGVIQGPLIMSIWDDEYGISVPNEYQLTKSSLSDMLSGFQRTEQERGFEILTVNAWDYEALLETYRHAEHLARHEHVPVVVHVREVTQPLGHSTSGSHERYKTPARLEWERDHDCLKKMREYLTEGGLVSAAEMDQMEEDDRKLVIQQKQEAWRERQQPLKAEANELLALATQLSATASLKDAVQDIALRLRNTHELSRREILSAAQQLLIIGRKENSPVLQQLKAWRVQHQSEGETMYGSHLFAETAPSPMQVALVPPVYSSNPSYVSGYEILNRYFDGLFERDARVLAFGEDVGFLGDVNQGFAGLQKKYGPFRIMDTGIREATIAGQAIGLALRGFRPIAEVQYLDYLLYALQTLSDDLATLHYRTKGGQTAPVIIRTRGHRLEGIWHAGSPMGMMIHALRGVHLAVPRNMTQAAGFYNTFMKGEDPAVIVEVLNGYRLKEPLPENLGDICVPLGIPEVLHTGKDITIVTYGACCRIAAETSLLLKEIGVEAEVIDVQTLMPFDIQGRITESLKKTNRILFFDEDVPGGATAYMMQEVLEKQGGYRYLDAAPRTLTSKAHRPAYGDDGDYFSKPQTEDLYRLVCEIMNESDPHSYPLFF